MNNTKRKLRSLHIMGDFIKKMWKYILGAFLLATLVSTSLCLYLIPFCQRDYGTTYFSYSVACAIWTGIYMLCVLFPAFMWLGRYSIFTRFIKDRKYKEGRAIVVVLLRIAIALFGAYEIIMYDHYRFKYVIITIYQNSPGAFIQFMLAVLFFIIALTNYSRIFPNVFQWNQRYPWLLKFCIVALVSFACFFNVEMLCESKMLTYMDMRFLNILYWAIIIGILYIIFRRVKISVIITLVLSYIVGIANYVVVMFRGKEILWGDITAWGTAMEVVDNYKFTPDHYFAMVTIAFVICLVFVIILPIKEEKLPWNKKRIVRTLISEAVVVTLLLIANFTTLLYGGIQGNYWDYTIMMKNTGYVPYLISNINYSTSVKLEDYSASAAKAVLKKSADTLKEETSHNSGKDEDSKTKNASTESPNIIMIMDEAFSDLGVNGDLQTNQDYMPYIHNMTDNTIKGNLHLSICGAPTANTEFEVLTRSSLAFLPTGSIPYNQYVTNSIPSLATVLKDSKYNYQTFAYHSYSATGYNRPVAYEYLGFDDSLFVEEEDMDEYESLRDYVTDSSDFKKLEEIFEEKKDGNPLFLFNVTMQNHGGYNTGFDAGDDQIEVTNFDGDYQLENYLSLIKKTDNAVAELTSYFANEEEPTMIIFYGDHQPKLVDETLEPLMGDQGGSSDDGDGTSRYDDVASRYQVPFFIWTNYPIEEQHGLEISSNYLSSYVLQTAGIPLTAYDEYLLELRKSYPVVTAREYWDAAGNIYQWGENNMPSVLKSYENIQYNCLFDKDNKLETFFNGTE